MSVKGTWKRVAASEEEYGGALNFMAR